MSGGMEDASAMSELSKELIDAAYEMRDAVKAAEEGHRGMSIDIEATVNELLLPIGWKLVRAKKFTGYR